MVPGLLFTSCVTLGKLLKPSVLASSSVKGAIIEDHVLNSLYLAIITTLFSFIEESNSQRRESIGGCQRLREGGNGLFTGPEFQFGKRKSSGGGWW